MHLRFLIPACVLASQVAAAQHESQWRFGVALSAPARLIKVNSITAPDSVFGRVDLGFGVGAEAARMWRMEPRILGVVNVRLTAAAVRSQLAGADWSPGRAFIIEAHGRIEREISDRTALFGGVGASHWAGPSHTVPFSGVGSILLGAEAGLSVRPGGGPWRIDFTANMTRFDTDETHGMATGFVWRWMMGVHRDR